MSTASLMQNRSPISRRIRDVQSTWSRNDRRQRAIEASRRIQEFVDLMSLSHSAPEIWAVGAPVLADVKRIAGQRSARASC